MKKTILHVSKYYYPYLGGIETLARSLAEGMVNYHNVVVCFATDGKDQVDEINGVTVYRVKVQFSLLSQDVAFGYYEKLKHLMAEFEPEYVHVHCPNPFVYPLVAKIMRAETKLVLHWHSDILSKGIFYQLVKPVLNIASFIEFRRSAEAQGVNLINDRIVIPVTHCNYFLS